MKISVKKNIGWITASLLLFVMITIAFFVLPKKKSQVYVNKKEEVVIKRTKMTNITPIEYEATEKKYQGIPRLTYISSGREKQIQEDEYFNIIKEKITKENLSAQSWFQNICNEFWLSEQADGKYFTIERHGYHQNGCPGDPMTSPRYDTFLIDKNTKEVYYDDVVAAKTITFAEWAMTISKE